MDDPSLPQAARPPDHRAVMARQHRWPAEHVKTGLRTRPLVHPDGGVAAPPALHHHSGQLAPA